FAPGGGSKKIGDDEALAVRCDHEAVRSIGLLFEHDPQPERLEPPKPALAAAADTLDRKGIAGEPQGLAAPGGAVIVPEGDIDEPHIEPEEPEHRPGAGDDKAGAEGETEEPEDQHQDMETLARQTAVRPQHALEKEPAYRLGGCGARVHPAPA